MRKALKLWGSNLYESLKEKSEENTPISTTKEQNFKSSLFLQVLREAIELQLKQIEDGLIVNILASYQNGKVDEVVKWINEVVEFIKEIDLEITDKTLGKNSLWCNNMISRIRKVRVKRGPTLSFRRVRLSEPLSLPEELYCGIISLINLSCAELITFGDHQEDENLQEQRTDEVGLFLKETKLQLEDEIHAKSSDWYRAKIAETSKLIAKWEPIFSLQSHDHVGSSLHEELHFEIRSLIVVRSADLLCAKEISKDHDLKAQFHKEIQERINEVNEFLGEIKLQVQKDVPEKNSDWYRNKIAETRTLISKNYPAFPFLYQDAGSSSTPEVAIGYAEEQNLTSSLQHLQLEKGTSTWMMKQNFKPSLFLQVLREFWELDLKHKEDYFIAEAIGSYQTERFQELMEWINEVEKFIAETNPQFQFQGTQENSYWCRNMLLRIRKLRAKRGPDLESSSIKLREELCSEVKLLVNISYGSWTVVSSLNEASQQLINAVHQFVLTTKLQLEGEIPETNSDWYRNKIAETRTMIGRCEPEFSHHPNTAPLSLHEELRREVRLLVNIASVYLLAGQGISAIYALYPELKDKYITELQAGMDEVNKFLTEMLLQLQQGKNSDWYTNKIAETKMLIARHYSAFPRPSQDDAGHKPQIFLSFRGGDTRKGFTNYLYEALHNEGFNVFRDNEGLKRGDSISQVLVGAIEKSKVSIIIFSKNYADSRWCLDEVNKILECKEKNGQLIWPIFYKVEPTDVRNQKNSYAVAMSKQEEKFGKDSEKVKKWRSSLSQIADLKALEYKENDDRPESDIIKEIIKDAKELLKEVSRKH